MEVEDITELAKPGQKTNRAVSEEVTDIHPIPIYAAHQYMAPMKAGQGFLSDGKTEPKPRLSEEEVKQLEVVFQRSPKPSRLVKAQLADDLGLEISRINNWFQNRRAKAKQGRRQEEYKSWETASLRPSSNISQGFESEEINNKKDEASRSLDSYSETIYFSDIGHTKISLLLVDAVKDKVQSNPELFPASWVKHLVVGPRNTHVAVKCFDNAQEFDQKLRILIEFQSRTIAPVIGAFTTNDSQYIISPWPKHGCLRNLWHNNPKPAQLSGDVEFWLIQQCWRISHALQMLNGHVDPLGEYVPYGDIKPENMLVFSHEQIQTAEEKKSLVEQNIEEIRSCIAEKANALNKLASEIKEIDLKIETLNREWNNRLVWPFLTIFSPLAWMKFCRKALTERSYTYKKRQDFARFVGLQNDINELEDELKPALGELKLAHFGITNIYDFSEESAPSELTTFPPIYQPPEMDISSTSISMSGDVWSLGCVFLEFVAWYVLGISGLNAFGEALFSHQMDFTGDWLTPIERYAASSEAERPKVMQSTEITKLITVIKNHPRATRTICDFLHLIQGGMLQVSKDKRVSNLVVGETLKELLGKIYYNPTEKDGKFSNQEQLRLTLYNPQRTPSTFDRLRVWLEDCIGLGPINWYPLPPVNRLQSAANSKLTWRYNDQELSIILNEDETNRCLGIVPLAATGKTSPPLTDSLEDGLPTQHHALKDSNARENRSQEAQRARSRAPGPPQREDEAKHGKHREPNKRQRSPSPNPDQNTQECYFCVDKPSITKQETYFSTPVATNDLEDDMELFNLLRDNLRSRLGSLMPWMAYNAVNLCQFSFMNDNSDLVAAFDLEQFPREESQICVGYSLSPVTNSYSTSLPLDIHMRKIGRVILAGLDRPDDGRSRHNVLNALPKRWVPPRLSRTFETTGWGFHVRFGVSFLSVALWLVGLMLLGLAFVPVWLTLVDSKDLQTAFTPTNTLSPIAALLLAWAALLQNRL